MKSLYRVMGISLLAVSAVGITLGMNDDSLQARGELVKKLQQVPLTREGGEKPKPPKTPSISSLGTEAAKSEMEKKYAEIEAKKKALRAEGEKKQQELKAEFEAAMKELSNQRLSSKETLTADEKAAFEAKYKEVKAYFESKKQALQAEMEEKMKTLKAELEKQTNDMKAEYEKKKEPKPQTDSAANADQRVQQLWDEYNKKMKYLEEKSASGTMNEEEVAKVKANIQNRFDTAKAQSSTTEKSSGEAPKKIEGRDPRTADQGRTNGKEPKKEKPTGDSTQPKKEQPKKEQPKKDVPFGSSEEVKMCKTMMETIRTEKEANNKEREAAWKAFREANKNSQKTIFVADSREDVKDVLDGMWLQIRITEKAYARALVSTSSVVSSIDPYLARVDAAAQTAWAQLADLVQPGQEQQFAAFRDTYINVLKTNKSSLYALMLKHAQTVAAGNDVCKKTAKYILQKADSADTKNQGLGNSAPAPEAKRAPEPKPATDSVK